MSDQSQALLEALSPLIPLLKWLVPLALFLAIVSVPLPGRGPGLFARRDSWRLFKYEARAELVARSGGRWEGAQLLVWGRCRRQAVEMDHVYPWSKGGPKIVSNGQALCREHNRRKSNMTPPWWYVKGLERRRARYFPADSDLRVRATMTDIDRAARARPSTRRSSRNAKTENQGRRR